MENNNRFKRWWVRLKVPREVSLNDVNNMFESENNCNQEYDKYLISYECHLERLPWCEFLEHRAFVHNVWRRRIVKEYVETGSKEYQQWRKIDDAIDMTREEKWKRTEDA